MKCLLIGSRALAVRLSSRGISHDIKPKDTDLIVENEENAIKLFETIKNKAEQFEFISKSTIKKFLIESRAFKADGVIYEVSWPTDKNCTTYELIQASKSMTDVTDVGFGLSAKVAPLDLLYTLKWSHRYLKNTPHFLKTMRTIKVLQRLPDMKCWDEAWLARREKETYDYAHPKLAHVTKAEFFNSNFKYVYDHDSIHEAVKLLNKPAYSFYMEIEAEVACARDKFFAQTQVVKLLGVLEEAYVLALERSQIPNDFKIDPRVSFNIALEKVCTSITSGWFRQFAWENYELVQEMYDSSYVDKFKFALQQGKIKPFKGE